MAHIRYVPNHREFGQLMLSDQIADLARTAAEDVVTVAKGISPVSGDDDDDRYIDHFRVESTTVTINGSPRAAADALNDSEYAARVEFGGGEGRPQGGSHGPPQRILGRAGAIVADYRGGPPA